MHIFKVISYRSFTMLFNIDLLSKIYKPIILCQIFKYFLKFKRYSQKISIGTQRVNDYLINYNQVVNIGCL